MKRDIVRIVREIASEVSIINRYRRQRRELLFGLLAGAMLEFREDRPGGGFSAGLWAQEIGARLRNRLLPAIATRLRAIVRVEGRHRHLTRRSWGLRVVHREGLQRGRQRTAKHAIIIHRVQVKVIEGEWLKVAVITAEIDALKLHRVIADRPVKWRKASGIAWAIRRSGRPRCGRRTKTCTIVC